MKGPWLTDPIERASSARGDERVHPRNPTRRSGVRDRRADELDAWDGGSEGLDVLDPDC